MICVFLDSVGLGVWGPPEKLGFRKNQKHEVFFDFCLISWVWRVRPPERLDLKKKQKHEVFLFFYFLGLEGSASRKAGFQKKSKTRGIF